MITTLILITILLVWLGYETDWLRVRLPIGLSIAPKYATYTAYHTLGRRTWGTDFKRGGQENGQQTQNYDILVSPGIDNVLCGWDWLDEHCADLVDYQPQIYMNVAGVRYTMNIKAPSILKDVMKVIKPSRAEKKALKYA